MNKKIIATQILHFGDLLQNQVLPELLRRFRQHNFMQVNLEKVVILCCRWAIWLNPSFSEAYYKLGRLLYKHNIYQEAAKAFEQAAKNGDYRQADAYFNLGRVLSRLKQFEESIAAFHQAIELDPEPYRYYSFLGRTLSEKGELTEAVNNYQIAIGKIINQTHPHVVLKSPAEKQLSAPNFLIIGEAKCGTSSLYKYLIQHPQILPAIHKEIHFWNNNLDKGLDWYLAHFPFIYSEQNLITGEATPNYLTSRKAVQSLFQEFPNMKLLVLLRNPVDRAISHYYMRTGRKTGEHCSLEEALLSGLEILNNKSDANSSNHSHISSYIKRSQYVETLSKWMELFPQEQFLIIKSEDLFADTNTIVNQIFHFLGVEPYQLPEYRNKNKGSYPPLSQSMRQTLINYFRPFNQRLEAYLDRKFNWDC